MECWWERCFSTSLQRLLCQQYIQRVSWSLWQVWALVWTLASCWSPGRVFPLWSFLRDVPDAAHPELRDVAPLRMIWWLSCEVPPATQTLWNDGLLHKGWSCPVRTDLCDWMQVVGLRSCSSHNVGPSQEWACSKGSNWGAKTTTSRGAWSDVILSPTTGLAQIGPLLGYSFSTDGPCQIPQP